ncbi:Nmad2 family putative nucleotide modification protein [Mucilaginibacter ginsenosidivorax]|uniref:Nucleotide modification associated domain-containing protein n=1 Tax=Mucilaginibacter ginsenosidivorax TaxID=862126 RepID=A0A5B8W1X5_9SPHI|nr:hypothetical protein [Mucilaginibacter ginsenosidivorax]QEC77469.1 hypothetical protein FSB76_16525 [Mucilaginibacter ginsenosidivorax]
MGYYSYKIEHDFGLAPNPFGKYCTLAVCKGAIRNNKRLQIGDWIFGTGSVALNRLHYLIYAMRVEEKITFEKYWEDSRFQYKKPVLNGSVVQLYGDNIYHKDEDGNWIQEDSAHSLDGGKVNKDHLDADTAGKYVLISETFYYFGDQAFEIPEEFRAVCSNGRSVKSPAIPTAVADRFVDWLVENKRSGINGDPINWKIYK